MISPTHFGIFRLAVDTAGGIHSSWHHVGDLPEGGREDTSLRADLTRWALALFEGEPTTLPPFEIPQGPPFFRACWEACRTIPPGSLLSYQALAARAGRPNAHRAAGAAMRHNPTPLLVPCHRVVQSGGGLGGFAGATSSTDAALQLKRSLLTLEGCRDDSIARRGILCPS